MLFTLKKDLQKHNTRCNPPSRRKLSTRPRHPSRRVTFLPCKRFVPDYSDSREEKTAKKTGGAKLPSKAAFNVNCLWCQRSIIRVQNNSPKHWKATASGTSITKLNIAAKTFLLSCSPSCLLALVAAQKIQCSHRLSRLGELHVKAGYVLTLLAW